MEKILLLNGPNLNMLGKRNPQVYGTVNFETIEKRVRNFLVEHDISLESFQSNHEGELIDALHEADDNYSGIIFNPGAYSHTSIALRDAVEAISTPVVEVHISNIYARESFRQYSYLAPVVSGQITGFGIEGYLMAAYSFLKKQS